MNEHEQTQGLTLRFDPGCNTLFVSLDPAAQQIPLDEASVLDQLATAGWDKLCLIPDALASLLAAASQEAPISDLPLAEAVDAQIRIQLAADAMTASLDLQPARGGAPASEAAVLAALQAQGVQSGILPDAIAAALAAGEASEWVIARGTPAQPGQDGWLESLLPAVRSRVPHVDERGHADYRDLGDIQVVHPGDALMRHHPPVAGLAGMTVLGTPIPPHGVEDVQFAPRLPGTALAAGDPDLLTAALTGQPVQVANGMSVEPVFAVESVTAASGNIHFDGSVVIRGDVQAGMQIKVSGDIEIGGVVEAANLEAGGNIVIKGGAIGDLGHPAPHSLRCGGCFSAGYASQARIHAGDSIYIDDSAIQCELVAINSIRIGNQRHGHLIGGRAQATFSIQAKVFGSPNRVSTRLEIGVNPVMHKQLQTLASARAEKENQLLELSKLLDFARRNPGRLPPDTQEKARLTAASLGAEIEAIRLEQDELGAQIELSRQARVIAEQALHEGVEVTLAGQHYCVNGDHGPVAIGLGDNGLGLLPLTEPG